MTCRHTYQVYSGTSGLDGALSSLLDLSYIRTPCIRPVLLLAVLLLVSARNDET